MGGEAGRTGGSLPQQLHDSFVPCLLTNRREMSGVNVPEYNAAIESSCEDSVGVPVARPYHFAVSVSHSRENRQRIALRRIDST